MKTCLICTSSSDDSAPTCPACGEASWGLITSEAPSVDTKADEVVVTDEASATVSDVLPIVGVDDTRTTPIEVALQPGDVVVHSDEVITAVDNPAPKKRSKKQ